MEKGVYFLPSEEDERRISAAAERIAQKITSTTPAPDLDQPYVSPDWDGAFEELRVEAAIADHLAELELTELLEDLDGEGPISTHN